MDTAEGVLVGNIDSLKMENGMVPVVSSAVKYFYQNGEFLANNNDWMDEYQDFKYDDYAVIQEEYKFSVRLPGQDAVTAEILGQGNRSAGIRMALAGMRHELGLKLVEKDK